MLRELDLHDNPIKTSEECVVSAPNNNVAIHLHDMLRPPLHFYTLPHLCRRLFRLLDGCNSVRQSVYRVDTKRCFRLCDWVWKSRIYPSHHGGTGRCWGPSSAGPNRGRSRSSSQRLQAGDRGTSRTLGKSLVSICVLHGCNSRLNHLAIRFHLPASTARLLISK